MTVVGDIRRTWPAVTVDAGAALPEAILDLGPVELSDHHWGSSARSHDGHVVLALLPTPPRPKGLRS